MSDFPETSPSLLDRLRRMSSAGSWEQFHRLYVPPIVRVARYRGLSANDAEDIAQQVMMAVVKQIGSFEYRRDKGRFRQWVRTVTENKIRDHFRRRRDVKPLQAAGEAVDPAPTPTEQWEKGWRLQDILFCLEQVREEIAPQTYQAFVMVAVEERQPREVADIMGIPASRVHSAKHRVLQRIRQILASDA